MLHIYFVSLIRLLGSDITRIYCKIKHVWTLNILFQVLRLIVLILLSSWDTTTYRTKYTDRKSKWLGPPKYPLNFNIFCFPTANEALSQTGMGRYTWNSHITPKNETIRLVSVASSATEMHPANIKSFLC